LEIQDLISACIKSDKAAEKQLYLTYAPYIYGISRRYSRDDVQAEDYMQEGFVKIFLNLSSFDSTKGNFKNWIARIVVNNILSLKRKEKIIYVFDDAAEHLANLPDESDDIFQYEIEPEFLLQALRELPDKYSTILNLYVFENLTHKEISDLIGIKSSSVRSRYTRAKKLLRNILCEKKSIAS